jgi:hypothetical protein
MLAAARGSGNHLSRVYGLRRAASGDLAIILSLPVVLFLGLDDVRCQGAQCGGYFSRIRYSGANGTN